MDEIMNEILSNPHDELSIAKNLVSHYSPQVLEIALLYAHYLDTYGVSITEKKETAVQQKEMLDRAYVRGRHDEREANRCIDCEAFNKSQLLVPQSEKKQWIPCSERLPEEYVSVLCYQPIDYGRKIWIGHLNSDGIWVDLDGWEKLTDPVTAWMPLPEPYKGDANG